MVNLVVRHGQQQSSSYHQPLQSTIPTIKLPSHPPSKGVAPSPPTRESIVPSPIRLSLQNRPVSPLTQAESLFGLPSRHYQQNAAATSATSRHKAAELNPSRVRGNTPTSQQGGSSGSIHILSSSFSADEGDLACDYDKNVTTLYELLESSQWDKATLRCRTKSDEVATWIVRRDDDGNVRWKLLPLHAAVIFQAPSDVIQQLLQEYPIAAGKRDDQGMLPLHLAFRHKQDEALLALLLQQYPQAISLKDKRDRLPIDHGKETDFSSSMVRIYAEAAAKNVNVNIVNSNTSRKEPPDDNEIRRLNDKHEADMETLKALYEERINAARRDHDQAVGTIQAQAEQDQQVVRTQHNQEMDEMRDLLTNNVNVNGGIRSAELQVEITQLQAALAVANDEAGRYRQIVEENKVYQEEVKDHLRKVVNDHKVLSSYCAKQQKELEQVQEVRNQLLRSFSQKDDAQALRTSVEIGELSETVKRETDDLLSRPPPGSRRKERSRKQQQQQERLDTSFEEGDRREEDWGQAPSQDHGDDISAITDNSF